MNQMSSQFVMTSPFLLNRVKLADEKIFNNIK
jgi:hypothetical protein